MSKKVSIIVTAFVPESKPYLDACLDSILNIKYDNVEAIIVSPKSYNPKFDNFATICPDTKDYWNSHALNFGAAASAKDSDYFFFLNDDVVLDPYCLEPLVSHMEGNKELGQLMPLSNDTQGKYVFKGSYKTSLRGYFYTDVLCTYAVLIPRRVFDHVGPYDEILLGHDDIDYSLRVTQAGYRNAIAFDSYVYHHGGVSAKVTLNDEKRADGTARFNKKWGIIG